MKKLLIIIGTRPEAIKMAPVIKAMKSDATFDAHICLTGQHNELAKEVLDFFKIKFDSDLAVMEECKGNLACLTNHILSKMEDIFEGFQPDCLLVQGDTTSAFAACLGAFYRNIKVAHIEAGLRTYDKMNPFPEEFNRVAISRMADFHFAPTELNMQALVSEKINPDFVHVTGNTVVDALYEARAKIEGRAYHNKPNEDKIILATIHRRENREAIYIGICEALAELSMVNGWKIVFVLHPNMKTQLSAKKILGKYKDIILMPPQPYGEFIKLLVNSNLIISDSGGIQEEATVLDKPILVVRKVTERTEAIDTGVVTMVGTKKDELIRNGEKAMNEIMNYKTSTEKVSPYGDGKASERIINFLKERL